VLIGRKRQETIFWCEIKKKRRFDSMLLLDNSFFLQKVVVLIARARLEHFLISSSSVFVFLKFNDFLFFSFILIT